MTTKDALSRNFDPNNMSEPEKYPYVSRYDKPVLPEEVLAENSRPKRFKRTKPQAMSDQAIIARLYVRGYTLLQITEIASQGKPYHLSISDVQNDIMRIRKQWRTSALIDYNEAKNKELEHIDELERAYWEAWNKSLENKEKKFMEEINDSYSGKKEASPGYNRKRVRKVEESSSGVGEYLRGIQWCIEQRCKILGLDAPKNINVNWRKEAEEAGFNASEIFNNMVTKFVQQADNEDTK